MVFRFLAFAALFSLVMPAGAQDISDLFDRVNSAVVVLNTIERAPGQGVGQISLGGLGSGVLIDERHVVTVAHVVQTADLVQVEFVTGQSTLANVVASRPAGDLALLELLAEPTGIRPVEPADPDSARVGSQVFIVGAPRGLSHTDDRAYIGPR